MCFMNAEYFSCHLQSAVHYYARERYFRKVATSMLEVVKDHGSDPILVFWKGYSTIMEG